MFGASHPSGSLMTYWSVVHLLASFSHQLVGSGSGSGSVVKIFSHQLMGGSSLGASSLRQLTIVVSTTIAITVSAFIAIHYDAGR
jgi:hypothetical protein